MVEESLACILLHLRKGWDASQHLPGTLLYCCVEEGLTHILPFVERGVGWDIGNSSQWKFWAAQVHEFKMQLKKIPKNWCVHVNVSPPYGHGDRLKIERDFSVEWRLPYTPGLHICGIQDLGNSPQNNIQMVSSTVPICGLKRT